MDESDGEYLNEFGFDQSSDIDQTTAEDFGSRESYGTGSKTSISEIAGQRLYQNALDTQNKIKEKIKERARLQTPTLNLATRGRNSQEPSPVPGMLPRYIQLYEHAKAKQTTENEEKTMEEVLETRDQSPTRIPGCERLYSLSIPRQQEGKERRSEIMKSKQKPPLPESHFKKIPICEATKIYDRGMKHLVSLEMKRMEAAFIQEEIYVSPLVPKSKEEEQFSFLQ